MVPEIEARVLEDLCRSRLLLEGRAVQLATVHVRGADIRHLRNLAQAHSQVSHGEGIYISLQRNQEFHFAVYRMAKSPILVELIEILWLRLGPYMRVLSQHLAPLVGTGNFRNGAQYHQDLINCLSERDGSGARFAIESDIRATYGMLCPLLPPGVS